MLNLKQITTMKLPTNDEMNDMDVETLKEWREKLAPFFEKRATILKRFDFDYQDYHKATRYLAFARMVENIEAGKERWEGISNYQK